MPHLLPLLLAMQVAAPAAVRADFEGGNIGKVEKVSETHLICHVNGEPDQDKRNRQPSWFYFRIDGVAGRDLTIDLTGLWGEYNYRRHDGSGHKNTHPVYSDDDTNWQHFSSAEWIPESSTIRVKITPAKNTVWIARQAPYTNRHLQRLLAGAGKHKHFRQETYGKSFGGKPLHLVTVTDPAAPDTAKKVIWLMARQHSWESGTSWVAEGLLKRLLAPESDSLRRRYIFKLMPMADPDGVARGGVRFNANGYDLNRNWDAIDPSLMPEIAAQHRAIMNWLDSGRKIDLFLTLHNTESTDYIAGMLSAAGEPMKALADRFWRLLDEKTGFYSPGGPRDTPSTTTEGMKGRMSVVQGLYAERRIPAFLMEQMVDWSPKLKRWPTVQDRLEFGSALLDVLTGALDQD